jgi:hypothetical protein
MSSSPSSFIRYCRRIFIVVALTVCQRYIYRIDHSRLNEFGQVSEKADEKSVVKEKAKAAKNQTQETKKTK